MKMRETTMPRYDFGCTEDSEHTREIKLTFAEFDRLREGKNTIYCGEHYSSAGYPLDVVMVPVIQSVSFIIAEPERWRNEG